MYNRTAVLRWIGFLVTAVLISGAHATSYDVWLKPSPQSAQVCAKGSFDIDTGTLERTDSLAVEVVYQVTESAGACAVFALGHVGDGFTESAAATLTPLASLDPAASRISRLSGGSIVAFNGPPREHAGWQTNGTPGSYLVVNSEVAHIPVVATLPLFVFGIALIAFTRLCRKASRISS
jgi:hypothetical protein